MTLMSVARGSWRCEPTVGAFLVSRVVWAADSELLVDDLERTNPLVKRLQITKDDALILEVHCMLNGAQDTSIEFLIPRGLSPTHEEVTRSLVAAAVRMAVREHLVRRPLGFGR